MQPIQPSDLFVTVAQMRDGIDTLIKRGKPVSPADLQQLIAAVEAKSRPTLDAAAVVRLLAPGLLAELPTPEGLRQAGQAATAALTGAMQQATAQSKAELAQAAEGLTRTAASIPRQVSVQGEVIGFTSVRAVLIFLGFTVVLFAAMLFALVSRSGLKDELAVVQVRNAKLQTLVAFFSEGRATLAKDSPEMAHLYFPYQDDPKPIKPMKARK
jgi:uncharacterized phage infection (PIP) family protein YhgE